MAKRRLKQQFKKPLIITGVALFIGAIVLVLYLFVFNNIHFFGVKSIQRDAKEYKTKTCLVFYPQTENGKKVAKQLCDDSKEDEEVIYDYALIPYGDYYLVEYGNNVHYYIDHNNKPLEVKSISDDGKKIIVEYLRYDMKKDEIDEAYTLKFIEETVYENINMDDCEYSVEGSDLYVYFPKYDYTAKVPLKYIQKEANINLGIENETYVKPKYISPNRKTVAFTFDDGPKVDTSSKIIDTLYKYDAVATFYVVGYNLDNTTIPIIEKSIGQGNEYGSHTQSHTPLTWLTAEEIVEEIEGPAHDLYYGYDEDPNYAFEGLGYTVKTYRAPGGNHNTSVDAVAPYITIEWDCDTRDWSSRDKDAVIEEINSFDEKNPGGLDGCIVLCHDLYDSTAEAIEEIVPDLIDRGYQFVTVTEMLNILGVDLNKAYYPW